MAASSNVGRLLKPYKVTGALAVFLGSISCTCGIVLMFIWLAKLGLIGNSFGRSNQSTFGALSGDALVFLSTSGLWCGVWVLIYGICAASIAKESQTPSGRKKLRTAVGVISAISICLSVVQAIVYALCVGKSDFYEAWYAALNIPKPFEVAEAFAAVGAASGGLSVFVSIAAVAVVYCASRIDEFDSCDGRKDGKVFELF